MPVSNSAFPALPPQPSWRIRAMMSQISMSRCAAWVGVTADPPTWAGGRAPCQMTAASTSGLRDRLRHGDHSPGTLADQNQRPSDHCKFAAAA